jgi:hypothetical protein
MLNEYVCEFEVCKLYFSLFQPPVLLSHALMEVFVLFLVIPIYVPVLLV